MAISGLAWRATLRIRRSRGTEASLTVIRTFPGHPHLYETTPKAFAKKHGLCLQTLFGRKNHTPGDQRKGPAPGSPKGRY